MWLVVWFVGVGEIDRFEVPPDLGNSAGGTTRPVKARSVSPTEETSRPVLTEGGPGDPSQGSTTRFFNCNNLNIRYWSWNYRGCWHQTCPPMDPR
ncbi:hypothetical protein YC2023_108303 [Brassica napus]